MKNDQPAGHPAFGSKCPNTHLALFRPSFATASRHTMIAIRPMMVQKMAKVYFNNQHRPRGIRRESRADIPPDAATIGYRGTKWHGSRG